MRPSALLILGLLIVPLSGCVEQSSLEDMTNAQAIKTHRPHDAVAGFIEGCVHQDRTREQVEAVFKKYDLLSGRTQGDFRITTNGMPVTNAQGTQFWSCSVSMKGTYADFAAEKIKPALAASGFRYIGPSPLKVIQDGNDKAPLAGRYANAGLIYDVTVVQTGWDHAMFVGQMSGGNGTSLTIIARPK